MAETMFKTLGTGYGSAAFLAFAGAAYVGGSPWSWLLFIWLAGAPLTVMAASLVTALRTPSYQPYRPKHLSRKGDAQISVAR